MEFLNSFIQQGIAGNMNNVSSEGLLFQHSQGGHAGEIGADDFLNGPFHDLDQSGQLSLGPGAKKEQTILKGILGQDLPKLTHAQQELLNKAKKYAMEQSIKMVLMKQSLVHQHQQARSLKRHQALVLMCRIYVGSIAFDLKEDTVRQAFSPFGPIKCINMSWDPISQKHKGFAFVDFEVPESAQLALDQMNSVLIGGRNIKVGRPSNMPQAQAVIDEIQEEAKAYSRIFITSVHQDLTEDDIKSVFEAFGTITSCKLANGTNGKHRGYGFIEYQQMQSALEAIASMNLFDLGGQFLRVGRAITPPNAMQVELSVLQQLPMTASAQMPTAAAIAAAAATAKIQAIDAYGASTAPKMSLASSIASTIPMVTPLLSALGGLGALNPVIGPPGLAMPQLANQTALSSAIQPLLPLGLPGLLTTPTLASTSTITPLMSLNPMPPASLAQTQTQVEQDALKKSKEEELQKILNEDSETQSLQQQENLSIKGQGARQLVMQKLMRKSESCVVILQNMVDPDEVDETLQEEITEECSKYGSVERVIIYQEKQSEEENAEIVVKIFVQFTTNAEASKAVDSLNSRYFGGRMISARLYDQDLYEHNDLSG